MVLREHKVRVPKDWSYPSTFDDKDNSPAMI